MTAKSRRRKAEKRSRQAFLRPVTPEETFVFDHEGQNVEVVAHSLAEAKNKFMFTYGYFPEQNQQETK